METTSMGTSMTTVTRIATSTDGRLALRVARRGLVECRGHVPLAARTVHGRAGWTRVVLVQTSAGPLAGDRIEIDVEIEAGAALELTATAATLAYPAFEQASISVTCRVGAEGRLAWLAQPLILAAGCDLVSNVDLELDDGAAAVVRETVVLGRHGERPGRYRGTIRCDLARLPLLRDEVRIDGADRTTALVTIGDARAVSTLAVLGARPEAEAELDELELHGEGRLLRILVGDAAKDAARLERAERLYLHALATTPLAVNLR
jgi:urease accessory protein